MTDSVIFFIKALFLGLVEGVTEFLPVSSTAHLLLVGDWIGFQSGSAKVFEIVIQLGSILAVMWVFRERLWQLVHGTFTGVRSEVQFTRNLIVAFLPAAVIGAVAINYIKALFVHPGVFVVTLAVGGVIMLWVERKPHFAKDADADAVASGHISARTLEEITWKQALIVGFAQCLAMVPGTSRSGATIISGMLAGIQRKTATEFSFFLAMPTMLAATVYDLYKNGGTLTSEVSIAIAIGFVVSFFSALVVVRALLSFISRHTYRPFAWYRIALAVVVLVWLWLSAA
ncbi:MAG: undecaprenyl-diphosphate phosphatase [Burkholderiaceae bacterium]|nr:MAG: undecaprenyl-diphosphate phosphatase [Burkholderiaceae bacterium]TAM07289.1 MAG: undecaprenyl-diphosphate phosphatase [Pusillimonas sp.]